MKTSVLFRTVVLAVMAVVCVANSELKAQEPGFVTNEVMNGDQVASKVVYRMDGALYRHMKYDFAYDSQNRMIAKEAMKWDAVSEKWVPYFKISYAYANNEISMEYARWNAGHKAYDAAIEKSVYELNDSNMPVAYINYKWNQSDKDWSMSIENSFYKSTELMAEAI